MSSHILRSTYNNFKRLHMWYQLNALKKSNAGNERIVYMLPTGTQLNLRFNDHFARQILYLGNFEPVESAVICSLVRPHMTVLDIGANIGAHTVHMAKLVGTQGHVLAFEVNPSICVELKQNIQLNKFGNVEVVEVALSNVDGVATFHFPAVGKEAFGSLHANSRYKTSREATVTTAQLDTVLAQKAITQVDFIKMDVEGAELMVLQGAINLLKSANRPPILYEAISSNTTPFGYQPSELEDFLSNLGYVVQQLDRECYLAQPVE